MTAGSPPGLQPPGLHNQLGQQHLRSCYMQALQQRQWQTRSQCLSCRGGVSRLPAAEVIAVTIHRLPARLPAPPKRLEKSCAANWGASSSTGVMKLTSLECTWAIEMDGKQACSQVRKGTGCESCQLAAMGTDEHMRGRGHEEPGQLWAARWHRQAIMTSRQPSSMP